MPGPRSPVIGQLGRSPEHPSGMRVDKVSAVFDPQKGRMKCYKWNEVEQAVAKRIL